MYFSVAVTIRSAASRWRRQRTLIRTSEGLKKIEELSKGDRVLTLSDKEGVSEQPIVGIQEKSGKSAVRVVLGKESVTVDPEHKFLLAETREWCPAKDLSPNLALINGFGQRVLIDEVIYEDETEHEFIDLSIEGNHNCYVSESSLLVHNFAIIIPIVTWTIGEGVAAAAGASIVAGILYATGKHNGGKEMMDEAKPAPPATHEDGNSNSGTKVKTPGTDSKGFDNVRGGSKAKIDRKTGEVWEKDMLHKDHWEVYKNKKDWEKGKRDRAVWEDGRLKQKF